MIRIHNATRYHYHNDASISYFNCKGLIRKIVSTQPFRIALFCFLVLAMGYLTFPRAQVTRNIHQNDNTDHSNLPAPSQELTDQAFEVDEKKKDDNLLDQESDTDSSASDEVNHDDHSQDHKTLKWWTEDPPGMDMSNKNSIWSHEISLKVNASRSDYMRKHPQLVFIKGLKVGGTSVALALDGVARAYGIAFLCDNLTL